MDQEPRYTVFVKVPFPRGDFVDPPAANWNAVKDQELWKVLSSTAKGTEIDWHRLAERFDVTLAFLLQQAACLYEKQFSQVRETLRRVKPSSGTSPTPQSISGSTTGGYAMRRGGSGSGGSRVPSSLSVRPRASLDFRNDGSAPSTPVQGRGRYQHVDNVVASNTQAAPYSRTASANTITQVPRSSAGAHGSSPKPQRRSIDRERPDSRFDSRGGNEEPTSPKADSTSPSSSSSSDAPVSHSRAFSRRQRFSATRKKTKPSLNPVSSADEDDEDDTPAFLPYKNVNPLESPLVEQDPGETLRRFPTAEYRPRQKNPSNSSSASLSSPAPQSSSIPSVSSPAANPSRSSHSNHGLSALSPRQRRITREGSEGTPSMGSSFSDLDDASITQSALEEALAREMKAGKGSLGVVSRMGGLWRNPGGQSSRQAG